MPLFKIPFCCYYFQVMAMISDLRETFIANLDNLDWMDTKTKEYAKEKVVATKLQLYGKTI